MAKKVDRGALVSSVMLMCQSKGSLDEERADELRHGSDLLAMLCMGSAERGIELRSLVMLIMEHNPGCGLTAAMTEAMSVNEYEWEGNYGSED